MIKVLLIAVGLLIIAMAGLGIRMLLDRNAKFSGGSCNSYPEDLRAKGYKCGCGGYCSNESEPV